MSTEKELNKDINDYVEMFNSVCNQIGAHLVAQVPKNRNIHIYNEAVGNIIKNKPSEPISVFVLKVYADTDYRESILNSNEHFFMQNDHTELAGDDKDSSNIITQVKSCWGELNKDSRFFIKEAFKTLIKICGKYIEAKDDLNQLKKKNRTK
jgi:hypothetical protein